MSTRFFSDAEIRRLRSWPEELGRDELIRYLLSEQRRADLDGLLVVEDGMNISGWPAAPRRDVRVADGDPR